MNYTIKQIKQLMNTVAVYVPGNCEGIRIDYCDDDYIFGTGEESGYSYQLPYSAVNPKTDFFYKLEQVDLAKMFKPDITKLSARELTNLINVNYPGDVIVNAWIEDVEPNEDGTVTATYSCTDSQSLDETDTYYVYVTEVNGKLEADY